MGDLGWLSAPANTAPAADGSSQDGTPHRKLIESSPAIHCAARPRGYIEHHAGAGQTVAAGRTPGSHFGTLVHRLHLPIQREQKEAFMFRNRVRLCAILLLACCALTVSVQQPAATAANVTVPPLVRFSGVLNDVNGKPLNGVVGVTFYLYKDPQGGAPLWMETQNVQPDKTGHYSVMLGSTSKEGLPANLFASGQARWLSVQVQGQEEQPRVLLMSVPYALKAADAETIGGLPPSAFMLVASSNSGSSATSAPNSSPGANPSALGGSGKTNFIPIWTSRTNLGNSALFQMGKGNNAQVGIGTTKPASTLDVNGGSTVRGLFSLPATGTATTQGGFDSQPINLVASVFNSNTGQPVAQTFQLQAEPVGNDTSKASGSLNLLFAQGRNPPSETGLNIASNGQITFAAGQTFPGTGTITGVTAGSGLMGGGNSGNVSLALINTCANGQVLEWNGTTWACTTPANGSITGVTAGTDLTGGGTSGNVTLSLDTSKVPQLASANTFTAIQDVVANNSGVALSVQNQGAGMGVFAQAGDDIALWADDSTTNTETLLATNRESSNAKSVIFETLGTHFGGQCTFDVSGDFFCTGTKSAVVPVNGGTRKVALYAVEAPENWFEDAGSAQLAQGSTIVTLDPVFAQTVTADIEYHVFLTPKGDCEGLYVSNETSRAFEVRELHNGHSNTAFDYRIMARRKGYENLRMEDMTERFKALDLKKAGLPRKAPIATEPLASKNMSMVPPFVRVRNLAVNRRSAGVVKNEK